MTRPRYPSKATIARIVEAARNLGLDVAGVAVSPDGTVRVYPPEKREPATDYDRWKGTA